MYHSFLYRNSFTNELSTGSIIFSEAITSSILLIALLPLNVCIFPIKINFDLARVIATFRRLLSSNSSVVSPRGLLFTNEIMTASKSLPCALSIVKYSTSLTFSSVFSSSEISSTCALKGDKTAIFAASTFLRIKLRTISRTRRCSPLFTGRSSELYLV